MKIGSCEGCAFDERGMDICKKCVNQSLFTSKPTIDTHAVGEIVRGLRAKLEAAEYSRDEWKARCEKAEKSIPPLDDDLKLILGAPNFKCGGIARLLRKVGYDIPCKIEEEQAFVIHMLLEYWKDYGTDWNKQFSEYVTAELEQLKAAGGE